MDDVMLAGCPFCGNEVPHIQNGRDIKNIGQYLFVWCHVCGAASREELIEAQAIAAWNRRAPNARTEALVEALESLASDEGFPYLTNSEKLQHRISFAKRALALYRKKESHDVG